MAGSMATGTRLPGKVSTLVCEAWVRSDPSQVDTMLARAAGSQGSFDPGLTKHFAEVRPARQTMCVYST